MATCFCIKPDSERDCSVVVLSYVVGVCNILAVMYGFAAHLVVVVMCQ